ncbi:HpcH/HpaI aldolase/citrate lyase family protein [Neorhizobium alkalisoli]|uniref:Citrate lyase subunit beta/citryl-CoA lyase n=1 Tax=Neorhizobium alkalisoli TaxID=528178 RepID=A0A561Q881_9HYPH|nr:CoA ester lyase [Neorhizobium alkalisoli]TWF46584.1 citrate lyase subunit beta/citryl-CoA lyase [Neorhizobium alkalisoli]
MAVLHEHLPFPVRRSVLSVPAVNVRALEKIPGLDCDAVILDLEDSVAPEKKQEARDNLRRVFSAKPETHCEMAIRINPQGSEFVGADLDLVLDLMPDAVLLPKVEEAHEIRAVADILSRKPLDRKPAIWAMIETPKGVLNAAEIAAAGEGIACLVVGLNDLRKETGVLPLPGRSYFVPWLMQVVLAGRAHGVDVIDSVFNDFRDADGFQAECEQGRAMGFSGKMLIHPAQIDAANRSFGPDPAAIAEAEAIVAAFSVAEAQDLNVINLDGKMVERLHLVEAEKLLTRARHMTERKNRP